MRKPIMGEPFEMNSISKGNIKITEYSNPDTEEVLRTYVQNGILGFFASKEELLDLSLLIDYYLNIEEISKIS